MTKDVGIGIVGAETLEKFYHGLLLGRSASGGRIAVGIESALVTTWIDDTILRDVVVVTDVTEATGLVAGFLGFYGEIPESECSSMTRRSTQGGGSD